MTIPVLHDFPLDPRCYSVRLAASVLGYEHRIEPVDVIPGGAHLTGRYRELTPSGVLPVLETGTAVLVGTMAVLEHLAAGTDWAPTTPEWLTFASGPLEHVYACRDTALYTTDAVDTRAALTVLQTLDDHLALHADHDWFTADRPTVADLALYPAAALSRDIGIDHDTFPALRRWMRQVKHLPGFVEMPGIPVFP
ncbi:MULTISPECIES: glutathione S-transferase family protein [unclassified Rhodococcus (in: high G+C Gram-positive bacteria)]|uniref:glutathione S-transferase family protein n=1 Tax=unclassified Rhodococcus (in: high G+C Gram-positive bacteria) TaxID=192944 RepID=UPI00146AC7BC|nr:MULTISPECIES: glutathione S-transferase family protein [unclassified Rhodococcus (in: high G+C Gram-positive bacteria)]NMD96321.1 glutathione S-transferase family protein [Rhodococcus sp. BL-253-APC-6A1W]NME80151.1 glutathione S-transferase family protein [Rhodococcus sp. 105337]